MNERDMKLKGLKKKIRKLRGEIKDRRKCKKIVKRENTDNGCEEERRQTGNINVQ